MKKQLTLWQRVLVAGTLFGMFFGAGNLIFPVHLGQCAGSNAVTAMIGFIISAVCIPILAVAAIGNTHSDGLQALASKVGKGYGYGFTCLLYLTIGPFFAIPRCATTSFTVGVSPLLGEGASQRLWLLVFSLVFFALVLSFSLRPNRITVWIGKIINPLFLFFFGILLVAALTGSGADIFAIAPEEGFRENVFFTSLIEGYGTMDAIAGLAFGIVVINIIRSMGVEGDSRVAKDVLRSGILTGILMGAIYVAAIFMGAQSRALFATSENGGIALVQIANHYLGFWGSLILAVTIFFACLKTSIGLVVSCSETFSRMFPKGPGYSVYATIFTLFSFCVSNFGLSAILSYSLPVLMFLYPLSITLIALALTGKLFGHHRAVYISVTLFTGIAALFDFAKTLPAGLRPEGLLRLGEMILPFYDLNLGWVVPALLGLIIGLLIRGLRKR